LIEVSFAAAYQPLEVSVVDLDAANGRFEASLSLAVVLID
jgi:hypothetical protein